MRKLFILPMTIIIWLVGNSCQKTTADNEPPINPVLRESEVEIPIITSAQTRTFYTSVPDENTIENLDILLFDSQGKFLCWRTTFKINGKLRTTLPVGTGYDAYFLANCRSFIEKILPDEATIDAYKGKIEWETFLEKLIDADPRRLLQNDTSFTSLPMWGILEKQEVKDQVINYWPLLSLIRSVASVDIYIDTAIENFTLKYAIGRDMHIGYTILGIKGRLVFEAESPLVIINAHKMLEKHTLTKWQQYWKDQIGTWYGMFLHEAQYLDPVMRDMEAFLQSSQQNVTGRVIIDLKPYRYVLVGVESDFDLMKSDFGEYGEVNKAWTADDVKGFTKILGNQMKIYHSVLNKNKK